MNTFTKRSLIIASALIGTASTATSVFAQIADKKTEKQKTVIKTITIINGDTSITEKVIDDKMAAGTGAHKKMVFISESGSMNIDSIMKANGIEPSAKQMDWSDSSKKVTRRIAMNKEAGKPGQFNAGFITEGDSVFDILIDKNDSEDNINEYVYSFVSSDGKTNKVIAINSKIIIEDITPQETGKNTSSGKNELKIEKLNFFPNPNKGNFTLEFDSPNNDPVDITITDISGKQVYKETVRGEGRQNKQIDISNESKGTYIIQLQQGKKVNSKKIIIE